MSAPNIATRIEEQARQRPDKVAIQFPIKNAGTKIDYRSVSFREFNELASRYASGLAAKGVNKGDRVLVFVKPSIDFPALVFALFKLAATPVLIDPGMGLKNLLQAISDVRPRVLISEPIVHLLRKFYRAKFKSVDLFFTSKLFGGIKIIELQQFIADFSARPVSEV